MIESPAGLDALLGHVAANLPDETAQAAAEAKARAAMAPLEKQIRAVQAEQRAKEKANALEAAAQHLYTVLFPAVYDDLGQKAAEGVNRAVGELRALARAAHTTSEQPS